MPAGFASGMPQSLEGLAKRIRACTLCRLHEGRTHAVPGEGRRGSGLFLLGEGPGRHEDEQGRPFVGQAGKVLDSALRKAGISRDDVFITNIVKCRPPDNRRPKADEVAACRPYLAAQIRIVRPKVIVTLGDAAIKGLLGPGGGLAWARRGSPRYDGIPILATYHPAAALYNRRLASVLEADLARASKLVSGRPRVGGGRPRPSKPSKQALSSGCAVFDAEGRVLLIRRADEGLWGLPKGTVERGETLEETALREVREETGLDVRIVSPLMEVRYEFYSAVDDTNVEKRVVYFLAERTGGRLQLERGFEDARWSTGSDAIRLLHYENDRSVVRRAFAAIATPSGKMRGRGRGARR